EIQVIAISSGPCGDVSSNATCAAATCTPLTVSLSGINAVCTGSGADVVFDFNTTLAGPFIVTYTVGSGAQQMVTLSDGGVISLPNLSATTTLNVISIIMLNSPDCVYPGNASRTITVNPPVNSGTATAPSRVCSGAA